MVRVALCVVGSCIAVLAAASSAQAQYRGMAPGWPNYANGQTAAYYAPAYGPMYGQPMYYVARPVGANANYAPSPNVPARYVPVTAAYANPAYNGGYNTARYAAQRPVVAAYYAPQGGACYSPTIVQYAPTNSYSVSPAGAGSSGAEAYPHYGQPTTVNYVPPRFTYRTTYAQVPVYMYRPVTTYDPVTAQPVTCLQPATTTQCQTQRHRWFTHSWFSHSWFNWHRSCGSGGAPPTTAYCGTYPTTCNSGQCGQPYYPVQPNVVIPAVPAPGWTPVPAGPVGPTVPPPPTRVIPGPSGGFVPADTRPSLTLPPGSLPRTTVPGATTPGGSFQVDPLTTPSAPFNPSPATPINPGAGGFGGSTFPSGTNYAPTSDPYSKSSTSSTSRSTAGISSTPIRPPQLEADALRPVTQSPSGPTLAPGVQAIPDPEAQQPVQPINRAPQLLDPRDKTARLERVSRGDQRWAVVPAVWPKPAPPGPVLQVPAGSPYRVYQQRAYSDPQPPAVNPAEYDDSGWRSAR